MEFSDAFDDYLEKNNLFRTEGDRGVENLEKIAVTLGYRNEGYRYGDPISRFLADNPGAIEAIHNWIHENVEGNSEWKDAFYPESIDSIDYEEYFKHDENGADAKKPQW